jgi:hypothetical protein
VRLSFCMSATSASVTLRAISHNAHHPERVLFQGFTNCCRLEFLFSCRKRPNVGMRFEVVGSTIERRGC